MKNISIEEVIELRCDGVKIDIGNIYKVSFLNEEYKNSTIKGKLTDIFKLAGEYYMKLDCSTQNKADIQSINIKYISNIV